MGEEKMDINPTKYCSDCLISWMIFPPCHLHTGLPNDGELSLEVDHDELVEKSNVVARVPTVPHRKEQEGRHLADILVVEEPQPLVDIVHDPAVGVDIKSLDIMSELRG